MNFVFINEQAWTINTPEELRDVKVEMFRLKIPQLPVYTGNPDEEDGSILTNMLVFQAFKGRGDNDKV